MTRAEKIKSAKKWLSLYKSQPDNPYKDKFVELFGYLIKQAEKMPDPNKDDDINFLVAELGRYGLQDVPNIRPALAEALKHFYERPNGKPVKK